MSRAGTLLQLQNIDLEIDGHRARLAAIEAQLGDNPAVQAAQRAMFEAQTQVHAARVVVQNLEYENQALAEKLAEANNRMYGGMVTNPKELRDLQLEIDSLQRRRQGVEERQFEALVAAEAAEVQHANLQQQLQEAEAAAARTHGDLLEERRRLSALVQQISTGREAVHAQVNTADRELYDRLRPAKKGRPVSRLQDGGCSMCGVAPSSSRIQSARQGNELILCGNCGRILCAD
jgi:predicted  nucleic acid-binding Zn-ribbon protein